MSDLMRPIPFGKLVEWMRDEYRKSESIFGARKDKIYFNKSGNKRKVFGVGLGSIIGPAAGPHSQLAQNIIVSYLCGARFMELKTVQIMDGEELRKCVAKPCIDAEDECYNVEWSTEMTVQEAFDEYVKAWVALHLLQRELGISDKRDFIFNMSVGYDLEGIKSPKIDGYIEGLKDASSTAVWKECCAYLESHMDEFKHFTREDLQAMDSTVCDTITLSTLHGCPPDEIERISRYLIEEKNLTTYVKCNPTLLGYERARALLDGMGYAYIAFDDHHFKADLQYTDAIAMFKRLQSLARSKGLEFGVKLSNTFPVQNTRTAMKGDEMYMSGRSLLPLTLTMARLLSEEFAGDLPISYSGGADMYNIDKIAATGICPITVATTLLKPGGYLRFKQLAETLEPQLADKHDKVDAQAIAKLVEYYTTQGRFLKKSREYASYKTTSSLPLFDCFKSPCRNGGCPIEQQVPEYLRLVAEHKFDDAFKVIAVDNAMPAVLSLLCDHRCQSKCTRLDYEEPLHIRNMKNVAVVNAQDSFVGNITPVPIQTKKKAVVIGAGPAGIAAGLFLRRNGMAVEVRDKNAEPFGTVRYVIPEFRIPTEMMERDYQMAVKAGVTFKFGVNAEYSVEELKKEYDYVILATGAWEEGPCPVKTGGEKLRYALEFLRKAREEGPEKQSYGKRVAVIGGGDVAMDCARTATRAKGVEEVVLVYRRTQDLMPALREELEGAIADGVKIMELLGPVSYDGNELVCEIMKLGNERDSSGRCTIVPTGKMQTLQFDTVVASVGARACTKAFEKNNIALTERKAVQCGESRECNIPGVYIAGDCKAGPSTIVRAVADAKAIVKDILAKESLSHDFVRLGQIQEMDKLYAKKGILLTTPPADASQDGVRCLNCEQLCEVCNDVCPNRANVTITVSSKNFVQPHQVVHLDGMCNECGNCGTFCPHNGRPYKDKVTVFWTEEDFEDSTNVGFLPLGGDYYKVRTETGNIIEYAVGGNGLSAPMFEILDVLRKEYPYYMAI